mmetsp:Transcript_88188/g.153215  ORF Transcript_88188/g.153215 Transcript_88188/m.153215 type:complete len:255 (-) Transcript_88188:551-1315(-)
MESISSSTRRMCRLFNCARRDSRRILGSMVMKRSLLQKMVIPTPTEANTVAYSTAMIPPPMIPQVLGRPMARVEQISVESTIRSFMKGTVSGRAAREPVAMQMLRVPNFRFVLGRVTVTLWDLSKSAGSGSGIMSRMVLSEMYRSTPLRCSRPRDSAAWATSASDRRAAKFLCQNIFICRRRLPPRASQVALICLAASRTALEVKPVGPPNALRDSMIATRAPKREAATAVASPPGPAPTTTKSYSPSALGNAY